MVDAAHLLVLGGQRSGKSRFAEHAVLSSGRRPVYVATATARDPEMSDRIATHRARRESSWTTVEEPLELAAMLQQYAGPTTAILVDCLTLWMSNLIEAGRPIEPATDKFLAALGAAAGPVVLVSNEVGSGIIPDNALARRFADALGVVNQRAAASVSRVVLMTAGMPVLVKPGQTPEIIL